MHGKTVKNPSKISVKSTVIPSGEKYDVTLKYVRYKTFPFQTKLVNCFLFHLQRCQDHTGIHVETFYGTAIVRDEFVPQNEDGIASIPGVKVTTP
jgi:hypothetical protein